jgi:ferredoxin-type protein NapG
MSAVSSRPETSRRDFLAGAARSACGAGFFAAALALWVRQSEALPANALRPPGALAEADFLGACARCGLCVRDCPYDTLKLAGPGQGPSLGTPYFEARKIACEMCSDIPCVAACPTGALDRGLKDIAKAKMGIAVLVGHETCLNYLGLRCDVCYRECPLLGKAITLERLHNERTGKHAMFIPTVHTGACTGCGKCEKACVLEESAIRVLPPKLALGVLGPHYQLGWEEQKKKGEALVPGLIDLPDRMPEPVLKGFKP